MPLRLRPSYVRRNNRTYTYCQFLRDVRKNGKPTYEFIAHFGNLPEFEAEALLKGLRTHKSYNINGSRLQRNKGDILVKLKEVVAEATRDGVLGYSPNKLIGVVAEAVRDGVLGGKDALTVFCFLLVDGT